jgi:hypothetical protein
MRSRRIDPVADHQRVEEDEQRQQLSGRIILPAIEIEAFAAGIQLSPRVRFQQEPCRSTRTLPASGASSVARVQTTSASVIFIFALYRCKAAAHRSDSPFSSAGINIMRPYAAKSSRYRRTVFFGRPRCAATADVSAVPGDIPATYS